MSFPTLRRGDTGSAVRYLQQLLGRAGYGVSVDAIFGPETENAVKTIQAAKALKADGVVGTLTWASLGAREADLPAPTKLVAKTDPVSGMPVQLEVAKPPLVKVTNAGLGVVSALLWVLGWRKLALVTALANAGDVAARQLSPTYARATAPLMGLPPLRGHWR